MSQENFTVHSVNKKGCYTNLNTINDGILPKSVHVIVSGYNYQSTPIFYRDGKKITPLEFSYDYKNMQYFFTLASPLAPREHEWILETYDFVEPSVFNQDTISAQQIIPIRRRHGYNKWKVLISS